MSDIPSSAIKIQTEATRFSSAVSESLLQQTGGSINYLIDHMATAETDINNLESRTRLKLTATISSSQTLASGSTFYTAPANTYALLQLVSPTADEGIEIGGTIYGKSGGYPISAGALNGFVVFVRPGQAIVGYGSGSVDITLNGIEFRSLDLTT